MFRHTLLLSLALATLPALAQTAPVAAPPAAVEPAAIPEAATITPPMATNYQPSDGTFGPHATCETAAPPASKSYGESVDKVLASYPGYMIFDQHDVVCGKKKALVLVLVSLDGSKPSRLHAIDLTSFLKP